MTIPTTLTTPAGVTPTRGELEADPLAAAFLQAFAACNAETGDEYTPDLDDPEDRSQVAILVRHLYAAGVGVEAK